MSAKIDSINSMIEPITTAPAAFTGIVEKVNEIIEGNPPLKAGVGIEITNSKKHRLISVLATPPTLPPFTLYVASGLLAVGITPGLVNGISPTFTGATAGTSGTLLLSSIPPPLKTISATRYFWIKCVGTFGAPDTYVITIHSDTDETTPEEEITGSTFTAYKYMGYVEITGGAVSYIETLLKSNQYVESYGSVNLWQDYQ